MAKYDKILDECWILRDVEFSAVGKAVDNLLRKLIACAVRKGVPDQIAVDTYVDWVRSHMRAESFMPS